MPVPALAFRHLILAVAVMAVWGSNFVVIKHGVDAMPPLLFAALRFTFAFFPLALFMPRPRVGWINLAAYGLLIGVGQFGLLFIAMRADITPGIASLVVQMQIFFTIGLAAFLHRERFRAHQFAALLLAASGLVVIALNADGSATPLGLFLVVLAALGWAGGNMVAKAAGPTDMLAYVVWSSLFPAPVLLALSLALDGPQEVAAGIMSAGWTTWTAVLWQAIGNTMFGYGVWGWLLAHYPSSTVAPLALLVPVFGIGASALFLGEALEGWKIAAAALVIGGLALGMVWRPASRGALQ